MTNTSDISSFDITILNISIFNTNTISNTSNFDINIFNIN